MTAPQLDLFAPAPPVPGLRLAAEFLHQHLDAYLAHLDLLGPGLNAVTFFI